MRLLLSVLLILGMPGAFGQERVIPPSRMAVDIYNGMATPSRMIAFMKIGASFRDQSYLTRLHIRIGSGSLPKAYLAGNLIYFKGIEDPLKIVDLKEKLFSFKGRSLSLKEPLSIGQQIENLIALTAQKRTYTFWDWFMPFAYADQPDARASTQALAMLAVSGLASSSHCLSNSNVQTCSHEFMGMLSAVGTLGLTESSPQQAFCSPDFQGGQKLIIAGGEKKILTVSRWPNGDYQTSPSHLNFDSANAQKAASDLLSICKSQAHLESLNVAFAYSNKAKTEYPIRAGSAEVSQIADPVPAAVPASVEAVSDTSGASR